MPDQSVTNTLNPIMNTYSRFPITLVSGEGSFVWTEEGTKYLDYSSGIATCNLGHCPEPVKAKLHEQIDSLWHCSNLYHIPVQKTLAEKLTAISCFDQVFFCNSGAEANEAAIKLAKKYANDQEKLTDPQIVSFSQSFHGRTGTTMAATAQSKIHEGFAPLTPGFTYLPFNGPSSLDNLTELQPAAVIIELVQGEGGVRPADKGWIQQLAALCRKHDSLLIIDEIQTGIGRTGSMFAYEQYGIEPDIVTLAKGLGSGFPVAAMLAKGTASEAFQPGTHGSTFGGNPLAMTAALATLETIEEENILANVSALSEQLYSHLKTLQQQFPVIEDVRGAGLLAGIQFKNGAKPVMQALQKKQVLCLLAGPDVLRILPPLTTTEDELALFITHLKETLNEQEDAS